MDRDQRSADEWKHLPWRFFEQQVFKLQKRIYRASHRGDVTTVHHLQRLLMRSWSAKCLAVRKVTQDNRGKKTAGVDGVKNLIPRQRLELAQRLTPHLKTRPVRRVWIPKPGKAEQRPLGIPTLGNRAAQTLVRLALEPEWEARFEPNSYGFRPGRSTHDAIEAIFNAIRYQPKYVLDADIAACFDRIAHSPLLNKLHTFPVLRRVIRTWLTAGVLDGGQLLTTDRGAPQGSAISPLLANVALHGLETSIQRTFPLQKPGTSIRWRPLVVRYADDFVVLHESLAYVERSRDVATGWLAEMGLELKPSKTRIVHTLRLHTGQPAGFDFLGSTVRQFPVGKTHTGKNTVGQPLGYKTLIRPSRSAQQRHLADLARVIRQNQQSTTANLVAVLNRKIGGWANFYSAQVSKRVFSKMDHLVYEKLKRWAERRHPTKSRGWVGHHYWHQAVQQDPDGYERVQQWVFRQGNGPVLAQHANTVIRRHTKVEGNRSPFDGDVLYWASRLGRHPELASGKAILLKRQRGRCAWCGRLFQTVDEISEVDHIQPLARQGADEQANRQLLHGHCHDAKTARDGSNQSRSSEVPMTRAKKKAEQRPG